MSEPLPAAPAALSPLAGYFADPALMVFDGRYWVYPTTDGSAGWSATAFRAFSSTDLVSWSDHGEVLRLGGQVTWSERHAWAPAIAHRDGSFFLYFTAGGGSIGVASAPSPTGPFQDLGRPLVPPGRYEGNAIDPSVFRDEDGTWYLLWGNSVAHIAPLGADMMSIDSERVHSWTPTGFREAISIHRHDDRYYASWSENDTRDAEYRVRYATGPSVHGPWEDRGVLLEQVPARGVFATGHHGVVRVPGTDEWIVAFHRFALEGGNGYKREVVFERLQHLPDGRLIVTYSDEPFRRPLTADPGP